MKSKIIFAGIMSLCAFGATSLAGTSRSEDAEVFESIKTLRSHQGSIAASAWPELVSFQNQLWKAMSLDPGPITLVPVKLVPKELFADELTQQLNNQLENLKQSDLPRVAHAQYEYDQYIQTVRRILAHRISRQWPQARAIAKRGTLDDHFNALVKKIESGAPDAVTSQFDALNKIEHYFQSIKDAKVHAEKKKAPFTNGNQFIWAALIAMIGFALGLTAIKLNPEFFSKFINANLPNPDEAQATGGTQLNYARWLREFEELLAKLKASQLTHERRIEEVFKHSEKMNQFATALATDPRIKNEANLEFRMSSLLREMHQQLEQTHELKASDRITIHSTLEHCLKLCDAIENGGIHVDAQHSPTHPQPSGNQNARVS